MKVSYSVTSHASVLVVDLPNHIGKYDRADEHPKLVGYR